MFYNTLRALAVLCILANCTQAAEPTPKELLAKGAQACVDAMKNGDFAKLADLTHPKVVEMSGGRESMIAFAKASMEQMKAQKVTILSYTVGDPGELTGTAPNLLCVVPSKMVMTVDKTKLTQEGYLLATSADAGKTWTFIDGAGLNQATFREFVPTAPKDFKLPGKKAPVIE